MRRSLSYYWRTHLAVICGAAVATAVLTGALLVGDSVRGSLRALTLERLGEIDLALIGERPFGVELTERLEEELSRQLSFSPVLMLRGSAIHGESRARASEVSLLGIGPGFSALYPERPPIDFESGERTVFPPVVLNRALADELGAAVGEQVLLSFERPAEIPRETLIGRQDAAEAIRVLRLAVVGIVDNRGPGGFALTPHQTRTFNAFLELPRLQRALFGREDSERVNLLLATTAGGETPALERLEEALTARLEIDDIGLQVRGEGQHLTVLSREFVLRPALGEALTSFAGERQAASQPVLTYLANAISSGERSVPYSTVSALDPPGSESLGPFQLIDGTPAPQLADDEILLNQWTADDLQVEAGAEIELTYFIVGDRDELSVQSRRFRLRGVLAMEGLAVDPNLTPEFPGIHEADDISAWDPPFPVALPTPVAKPLR
jgi:hypothetical protein